MRFVKNRVLIFSACFLWCTLMAVKIYYETGRSLNGIDDANIYMVYMKNFAQGYGFLFNQGGEKVEGFTSLLWTLIGSLFYFLTDKGNLLLLIFNLFLVSYAHYRIVLFALERTVSLYSAKASLIIFSFLLLVVSGYYEWTLLSLLETSLWSTLLILLTINTVSNRDSTLISGEFITLLVLLVLTRPEAMIWGLLFLTIRIFFFMQAERSLKRRLVFVSSNVTPFFAAILLLVAWRLYYFGYPFPNTYYAKVSSGFIDNIIQGLKYDVRYFVASPVSLLIILFIAVKIFIDRRKFSLDILLLFLIFLFSFIPPLLTGGDHFANARFIQPLVPVLWLSFILSLPGYSSLVRSKMIRGIAIIIIALVACFDFFRIYVQGHKLIKMEWTIAEVGKAQAQTLNEFFNKVKPLPSTGVSAAGAQGLYYKGKTIDLLGLNNVEMAHASKYKNAGALKNHASFNKNIFYKQHPDLFLIGSGFTSDSSEGPIYSDFEAEMYLHIPTDSLFRELYVPIVLIKDGFKPYFTVYGSRAFLDRVDTSFYRIKYISK